MATIFQDNLFQNNVFQTTTIVFQLNVFQHSIFQNIGVLVPPEPPNLNPIVFARDIFQNNVFQPATRLPLPMPVPGEAGELRFGIRAYIPNRW